jgi:hypothetical protein
MAGVKTRRKIWMGHAAHMGRVRSVQGFDVKTRGKEKTGETQA